MPKKNTCSEDTIERAFQLVLRQPIQFSYDNSTNDDQIDISPVFMKFGEGLSDIWTSGDNVGALSADFSKLNKKKCYFMRVGQGGGAGHYQLLSFDDREQGWRGFSSKTNQVLFTQHGEMTGAGKASLMTRGSTARWGTEQGQYSILIQEATPERIIAAANFVQDYRMAPQDPEHTALTNLFAHEGYPELDQTGGYVSELAVGSEPEEDIISANEQLNSAKEYFLFSTSRSAGSLTSEIQAATALLIGAINELVRLNPSNAVENLGEMNVFLNFEKDSRSTQNVVQDSIKNVQLHVATLLDKIQSKAVTREFKSRLETSYIEPFKHAQANFSSSLITGIDLDDNTQKLQEVFLELLNNVNSTEKTKLCREMMTYLNMQNNNPDVTGRAAKNSCQILIESVRGVVPPNMGAVAGASFGRGRS